MTKKIISTVLVVAFIFFTALVGANPVKAQTEYSGKLVKMAGLSSLYYVASDGNRYVFPNEKIYDSWFTDFGGVQTLTAEQLQQIPLRGNVLYRPGVVLVKINTDPKIYAVSKEGQLRWVQTETIAKALYGDNWNKLVDDIPDSFFVNYSIGQPITSVADFNPGQEAENIRSIEANINLATVSAKLANTALCRIVNNNRDCRSNQTSDNNPNNTDTASPYVLGLAVANGGSKGFVDVGDSIAISFSEAINPKSISSNLTAGGSVSGVSYSQPGGVKVFSSGKVDVTGIASFDLGAAGDTITYVTKLSLNATGKILTITLTSGADDQIISENFTNAVQTGGQIQDLTGNVMAGGRLIANPLGTFGGIIDNGSSPSIASIEAANGGKDGYLDVGDTITITFTKPIDPQSVDSNLQRGGYISDVQNSEIGAVSLEANELTVNGITSFYVGLVSGSTSYISKIKLNDAGDVLTITLTSGSSLVIWTQDFTNPNQVGGVITDLYGNEMKANLGIADPVGTFGGSATTDETSGPIITDIHVANGGNDGYVDVNDSIAITFDKPIDPQSVHSSLTEGGTVTGIAYNKRGGIEVTDVGEVIITDIASFDLGAVNTSGTFTDKISLNASGKVLTLTITDGTSLRINREIFSTAKQIGGAIADNEENVMATNNNLNAPSGTFGGAYGSTIENNGVPPKISSINIANGGTAGYIDNGDTITITFSEPIDPESINQYLDNDTSINGVSYTKTGGVSVFSTGLTQVAGIFSFDVGATASSGVFDSTLRLNATGDVLTIILTNGSAVQITSKNFNSSTQTQGVISDLSGTLMNSNSNLTNPTGSF